MNKRTILLLLFAVVAMMWAHGAMAQTNEAYVVKSTDEKSITFYFDNQRSARQGTTYAIDDTQTDAYKLDYPAWAGTNMEKNSTVTRVVFDPSFKNYKPTSTRMWMFGLRALTEVEGLENLDTSNVTDMSSMFAYCESLPKIDVEYFNTAKVTDMSYMFQVCFALHSLDVSKFNTSNVTNMKGMFSFCKSLTMLDVADFNTERVTDMALMFNYCNMLTSLDVIGFNTDYVTDMTGMFAYCSSLKMLDLTKFSTTNVASMERMFVSCSSMTTIYCNDTWNSKESDAMFDGCTVLKGVVAYDHTKTDVRMANPVTGYFTKKAITYPLIIAGVPVTSDNADNLSAISGVTGRAVFDADDNILTLENVNIQSGDDVAIVNNMRGLTIRLVGDNKLTGNNEAFTNNEPVLITSDGTGTMTVESLGATAIGLLDNGDMIFDNCTVTALGEKYAIDGNGVGTFMLRDATLNVKGVSGAIVKLNEKPSIDAPYEIDGGYDFLQVDTYWHMISKNEWQKNVKAVYPIKTLVRVSQGTTTGLENVSLGTPHKRSGIYNLHGVLMDNTADNLPAGIYIIDGKKVVKR